MHPSFCVTLFWIIGALSFCITQGCGYRLKGTGEPVGIQISSLAIPMIVSTSSQPGFEADFTRIIREEFISHAKVPLVSREEAAAVLIGEVYEIRTDPLSYSSKETSVRGKKANFQVTTRRRVMIRMTARMIDRGTGAILWEDYDMVERSSFEIGIDPLRNESNAKQAIGEVARRFAERIYLKTMERF
jgi:hypothetical protein